MTIRNLDHVFRPRSVVLIGASPHPNSIGHVIARNLLEAPFHGDIFFIHPTHREIEGRRVYPSLDSLDHVPELAVIATPAETVPKIIAELGEMGNRAAVVISAGFGERGDLEGRSLCGQTLEAAQGHLLRIVGPNCLGIMVPHLGLNASFAHMHPLRGNLAFVAQSGAIQSAVLDWATSRGIGFSHFVALGDMADVDFGDMLDYLTSDPHATAILLYMETITHACKFMSAARAASRLKPVIVLKGGRHEESARAVTSHTGAMAGSDDAYDAAFRRAGMLRVYTMQELFDSVETLARVRVTTNRGRVAIMTNGGGMGVLAADSLLDEGGELAALSQETMARLNEVLPPLWSQGNPVDMVGDATRERYGDALRVLLDNPETDAILALNCPNAILPSLEAAETVVEILRGRKGGRNQKPVVLTAWTGGNSVLKAKELFAQEGIPHYDTPSEAVQAFMQMVRYQRNQEMLMETPPRVPREFTTDSATAHSIIGCALSQGREWLTEVESKRVLGAYGISVLETHFALTPEEAGEVAEKIGRQVVLKILSPDIVHKSEAGGVHLNLEGREQVEEAARWMVRRARELFPEACVQGFSVQEMIFLPNSHELIIGMTEDLHFGPILLFGQGGLAAEVVQDRALALPPLNMHLAEELMSRTRIYRILKGYRTVAPVDTQSIALTLVRVSQLVCDIPQIVELDINPILAHKGGVMALDARIRVAATSRPAEARLAIRPYPNELEEILTLPDGKKLKIRPVRPEDEPAFQQMFRSLTPEEIRLRFLHPMREIPHSMAARLTQIDYDREMALVIVELAENAENVELELLGAVRIMGDPDGERAEFAILIRRDRTGMGLGPMLMRRIIEYARARGLKEIWGEVLPDNAPMLKLAKALGFSQRRDPEDPGLIHVTLDL